MSKLYLTILFLSLLTLCSSYVSIISEPNKYLEDALSSTTNILTTILSYAPVKKSTPANKGNDSSYASDTSTVNPSSKVSAAYNPTTNGLHPFFQSLMSPSAACNQTIQSILNNQTLRHAIDRCFNVTSPFFSTTQDLCSDDCHPSLVLASQMLNRTCDMPIFRNAAKNQASVYRTWANLAAAEGACTKFEVPDEKNNIGHYRAIDLAYRSFSSYYFHPHNKECIASADMGNATLKNTNSESLTSAGTEEEVQLKSQFQSILCKEWNRLYYKDIESPGAQPLSYYWTILDAGFFMEGMTKYCGENWRDHELPSNGPV